MDAFLTKKSKKEKEVDQNPKIKENQPTGKIKSFFTTSQPKIHDSNSGTTDSQRNSDVGKSQNDCGIKKNLIETDKVLITPICLEVKNLPLVTEEKVTVHPLFLPQKLLPDSKKSSLIVDLNGKEKQKSSKSSISSNASLVCKKDNSIPTASVKKQKLQSTFLAAPDAMPCSDGVELKQKLDPNTENIKSSRKTSHGKKHGEEFAHAKRSKLADISTSPNEGCDAPVCSDVTFMSSESGSIARVKEVISLFPAKTITRTPKTISTGIERSPDLVTSINDIDESLFPNTASEGVRPRGPSDKEPKVSVSDESRRSKRQANLAESAAQSHRFKETYASQSDVDDFIADSGECK